MRSGKLRRLRDPAYRFGQPAGTTRPAYRGASRGGNAPAIALRPPPQMVDAARGELLHAASILYAIGEHDIVLNFVSDLADVSSDTAVVAELGELTAKYHDAQATLLVGKTALARGMAMEQYAFPDFGVPSYSAIGPAPDPCIVYSVARTESAFDQRDRSSADAVGLMQVTPQAGRDTAKRLGVSYDWHRLVSDPVYNTQWPRRNRCVA